ncbi:MAG: tRNA-uridine aminocarboxypropyltransferase [Gammaproteobacteria bacterium]
MTVETVACPRCGKAPGVCICDRVEPVQTRLRIVILQHPQEDDAVLGTAKLVTATIARAEIRVGLSWASLEHAVGGTKLDRSRWAVLATAKLPGPIPAVSQSDPVLLMDRHGKLRDLRRHGLDGIIVIDGTWSQAKTLWWRNAWFLKLPRLVLKPRETSMYGRLRKSPRKEWMSTLEAIADVLPALGEPEAARANLRRLLRTLLQRARDTP